MANGSSKAPKSQTMGLLIALAVLNMVGFLVLYFKVDIDSSMAAGDAALLSQQLARIESRLNKMQTPTAPVEQSPQINGMMPINGATGTMPGRVPGMPQNY